MHQLIKKIAERNGVETTLYVNFEEPGFLPYLSLNFLDCIYDVYRERVNPSKKAYIFLDEIQNVPGWEKWVRAVYDKKENVKIIISGSSSKLLSSEFSSLLTGRVVNFVVFPLSFAEFLDFKGIRVPDKVLKNDERIIRYYLNEYIEFGGFPEIVLKKDNEVKKTVLQQYFESMIMKDVVERYNVRDVLSLKSAAVFGLTNVSKEFSFNSLRKFLKISLDTAKDYINYLEQAYILFQLPYFSYSPKEVMVRNRKLYAVDTGLRNAVSKTFTPDKGRLLENITYLHLKRTKKDVYYWKEKREVDFVINGKTPIPINVTCSKEDLKREEEGILNFLDRFKVKEGIIITDEEEKERKINNRLIRYIPVWKFLLKSQLF